jgi:Ala-tRNA(Pro) deacylase
MLVKLGKPLATTGTRFVLAVMSASCELDWTKFKALVGQSKAGMATLSDVAAVTGCLPGAVPPFGSLFDSVTTFMDESVTKQGPEINFNAGLRTFSILGLSVDEYKRIEAPVICAFSA